MDVTPSAPTGRLLVIYESMFGNTKSIADAVAFGLAGDVELIPVEAAPTTLGPDVDLVVVGAPTHAFGLSRRSTRNSALRQGGETLTPEDVGVREWIGALEVSPGTLLATFDTRIDRPRLPGSAARSAARLLRRKGIEPVVSPASFFVIGTSGPLKEGERHRALRWGAALAHLIRRRADSRTLSAV
ncbi:MAG TPA: flavodoxin [Acidimicrobiia bacterium]|nr:flavodoxin [Acidimicrobiia bacterium]